MKSERMRCIVSSAVLRTTAPLRNRGGRKRALSKADIRKLDSARRRLIKGAKNQKRVTYKDVIIEAGFENLPCRRVCEDALRNMGVSDS